MGITKSKSKDSEPEDAMDRFAQMHGFDRGPNDPLYRTGWYFVKASKNGADISTPTLAHSYLVFSDADVRMLRCAVRYNGGLRACPFLELKSHYAVCCIVLC